MKPAKLKGFTSSNVKAAEYDKERKMLTVRFNDSPNAYHYKNVQPATWARFRSAKSKGRFVYNNIAPKFDFVKTPKP